MSTVWFVKSSLTLYTQDVRRRCCRVLANGYADWELLEQDDDRDQVFEEGVGACIWQALSPLNGTHEHAILPQLKTLLRSQAAIFLLMRKLAANALSALGQAGVPCLILRGQALAETLYQPVSSRPQTDIDILVPDDKREATGKVLIQAGWQPVQAHPLLFIRNNILLDIHIEPLGIDRIQAWAHLTPLRARDFFAHTTTESLADTNTLLVHPCVNLPYLCFHAMKHSFNRLIWLWDIALLSRQVEEKGQWAEVRDGIHTYRLERPAFYALSYVRQHLAAPVSGRLLETIRPSMDWREQQMFAGFMQHKQIPFLAERLFARMQPTYWYRLLFWKETIFPRRGIRRQINEDDAEQINFLHKRMRQIAIVLPFLWHDLKSMLVRK